MTPDLTETIRTMILLMVGFFGLGFMTATHIWRNRIDDLERRYGERN